MADDYRPTEPVQVYETFEPPIKAEEAVEQLLPPRSWKENPLLWIGLVVAVFMAVPFLANRAARAPSSVNARAAQPASAPVEAPVEATTENATPERSTPPANVPDRPAPLPARAVADPGRQMVTKCIDRGRVVYTQTGECAGSVSAVPIDTSKNVVGPSGAASR